MTLSRLFKMQERKIEDSEYDLELKRVAREINKIKARRVLIQLPDGLKIYAKAIVDYLRKKTKAEIVIWMGSCFGACDTPKVSGFDLLVQFGHTEFVKTW